MLADQDTVYNDSKQTFHNRTVSGASSLIDAFALCLIPAELRPSEGAVKMSCVKVQLGAHCTLLRYQAPRGPLTDPTDVQLSCHHTHEDIV